METAKEKAKEFLENINKKDRVGIICHDDLDGFASGILLYDYLIKKCKEVSAFPSFLTGELFPRLLPTLKKFNKIIITDIPPHYIKKELEELKNKEILYIDHHQKDTEISDFILEYRAPANKYFPASKMAYELVGGKEWLGVAGTITDVGYKYEENKEFIYGFLKKINLTLAEYQEKVTFPITDFLIYFHDSLKKAFDMLKKIAAWENLEEINKYAEPVEKEIQQVLNDFEKNKQEINNIWFYYFEPKFKIKSIIATKLALKHEEKLLITASPSKHNPEKLEISGRCQSGNVNIPELLKNITMGFKNASVGGHLRAAGGFIQKKDLEKFKENLKAYSETLDKSN